MKFFRTLRGWLRNPKFLRHFHGWSALGWFIAAFPIMTFLSDSVPFIVFISVYAIVVSHWEGWMTSLGMDKEEDPTS